MGLFSWLKKTGSKASTAAGDAASTAVNTAADAAKAASETAFESRLTDQKKVMLSGLVNGLNLDIQNFDLEFSDGKATVYGQVTSDGDKSMIISALESADGISFVDNRISVLAAAAPAVAQTYVVKAGDSLSKIAKVHYGDPMKYKEIFAANQDVLEDPNKIFPGQELKIPNLG